MPTPAGLEQTLTDALGRLLAHLEPGGERPAAEFAEQLRAYNRIKGARGRRATAEALGLAEAELPFLDAALRDVERTASAADGSLKRNALLARMRLLSWLETIGQRTPALVLDAEVETSVSEDLGRKQVRAVELIVRSLITESHGDQEALLAHLRQALNERVVEKWQGSADEGDILSGLSFGELASLFVNKEEFGRYEALYEDTPFLTLLKQRRRTIQSFLDDIRRIRNVLAHNKHVTPIQLSLLDLYYEEIVTPVQTAFDHGETRIDPDVHLDASPEELEQFMAGLHQDMQAVRDDLADLRDAVMVSLDGLEASTTRIEASTTGINRKLVAVGGALAVVIGLAIYLIGQGDDTQTAVDETHASTERTEAVANRTAADVDELKESHRDLTESAKKTEAAAKEAAEASKETAEATKQAAAATESLAKDVKSSKKHLKEAAKDMRESTEVVVQTLEELRKGFAALTQTGGIIAAPRRPQEHYHNARLYEQRGDYAKALESYRAFFAYDDLEFVDPHLRFQSFLKLQRGLPGAREVYYDLKKGSENAAMIFAWNLLLEDKARADGLESFLEAHPDFAPAVYARSRDFSVARLGSQTMGDKRSEKKLLTRFLALQKSGTFLRYYLDQAVAAEQIADAKERLAALSSISDAILENPVQLSTMQSNQGWTITLTISDRVKEIFVRIGDGGDFKSTGFLPGPRGQDGLPRADPTVSLKQGASMTTVHVKYHDVRGQEHGPYALLFDPAAKQLESTKHILSMLKNSWLSFRDMGEGRTLMYFTSLLSYRSALKEIRYALDKDTPDTRHPFSPADPKNPFAVNANDKIFISVPATTKYATIQLTFTDGSTSEVVRIDR